MALDKPVKALGMCAQQLYGFVKCQAVRYYTNTFTIHFTISNANDEWNYYRLVIVPAGTMIVQLQLTVKTPGNPLVVMFP